MALNFNILQVDQEPAIGIFNNIRSLLDLEISDIGNAELLQNPFFTSAESYVDANFSNPDNALLVANTSLSGQPAVLQPAIRALEFRAAADLIYTFQPIIREKFSQKETTYQPLDINALATLYLKRADDIITPDSSSTTSTIGGSFVGYSNRTIAGAE